ncbi:MAG: DUF6951 family protein [Bacillota bacterium]
MMTAEIDAGNCGLNTVVNVRASDDRQAVTIELLSECPNVQEAAEELAQLAVSSEVFGPGRDTQVCQAMGRHTRHPGCPVAAGILKAIEAELGLAFARDITIKLRPS